MSDPLATKKAPENTSEQAPSEIKHFLQQVIEQDQTDNKNGGRVVTRFPPEPNGFLHIGHARSIWLNFGLAKEFGGQCNLRFDDTNPEKEEQVYVDAIKEDVQWLGYQWADDVKYASNYFDKFYEWALHLINEGHAYVCHLSPDESKEYRGWATRPGKESPHRNRSVEENLAEFEKMKSGEYDEGKCVLRAKIDMTSPNMNLRDPILYRIRKISHHQTGDKWCIYPSYDFAHGQEDAIEGVTHSICTLEFQAHRPLYEWFIEHLPVPNNPRQYEFGRLNLNYTVTSKRKLRQLVEENVVNGWDDPRMPTVSGMRRRGYTPTALKNFCDMIPVSSKNNSDIDVAILERAIRDDLNDQAKRAMCVMNPLKVTITNMQEGNANGEDELLTAAAHPNKPELGDRKLPFTDTLFIDQADFTEEQGLSRKKFKRLVLGEWVRLRGAYIIKAEESIKNGAGEVVEVRASLVADSVGNNIEGIKPRGVIHWVSAEQSVKAEVRLYDRLFNHPSPDAGDEDFMSHINPDSYAVIEAFLEPDAAKALPEDVFQFEREGYFVADRYDHDGDAGKIVFNQTIGLKDSWSNK
jgi:glutaminyl-tRNA synthetase